MSLDRLKVITIIYFEYQVDLLKPQIFENKRHFSLVLKSILVHNSIFASFDINQSNESQIFLSNIPPSSQISVKRVNASHTNHIFSTIGINRSSAINIFQNSRGFIRFKIQYSLVSSVATTGKM